MAEQEILFDLAQASHAQAILDFFEAVALETDYLLMDGSGTGVTADQLAINLARRQDLPNHLCLLAKQGDQVIGLLNIVGGSHAKTAHIGDLFIAIRKAYWGHGIGQLMLQEGLDWAQEMGVLTRIELTVQDRNQAAIALYEKLGFVHEGTKKRGAKSNDGDYLDVRLMAWLLDDEKT